MKPMISLKAQKIIKTKNICVKIEIFRKTGDFEIFENI